MYIDEILNVDDLYQYLSGDNNDGSPVFLLSKATGLSRSICDAILKENNNDFFKSHRKIIEDQYKLTLVN